MTKNDSPACGVTMHRPPRRCFSHPGREGTHAAFARPWSPRTMGARAYGTGGAAWWVCADCAEDFSASCRAPESVRPCEAPRGWREVEAD